MKAVIQNFRSGVLSVAEVPPPALRPEGLLVRNSVSLISAGTEKAVIELARMNPLQKSRARPDLVKKVLNRASQEGLIGTAQIVRNLVSSPLPLGYSCAGVVEEVGAAVGDIKPGDHVGCAGLGYANHAEVVYIPRNLAVAVPKSVSLEEASFVTVGAIALHGVRQARLQIGEHVVVVGLGLVGQIVAQICQAAGYRLYGVDRDPWRVELARKLGLEQALVAGGAGTAEAVRAYTRDLGADAIIVCASTADSQPVELAAELARDRGRVVSLGETGLNIPRRAYYEKEIALFQSRSYGPGRYDPIYEEHGIDYPAAYVRWTENRNMEAFLDLLASGRVRVAELITHRVPIEDAEQAYELLTEKHDQPFLGIVLDYDPQRAQPKVIQLKNSPPAVSKGAAKNASANFGIIGAGQFAQGILLPLLRKIKGVSIVGVATASGITARTVGDKYDCSFCTSDFKEITANPNINAVLIATRHNLHAQIAAEALAAGKHVFVEKPLALNSRELAMLIAACSDASSTDSSNRAILTVGYNRRFSPLSIMLKQAIRKPNERLVIVYRINAGKVEANSWIQDPKIGGGRIIGEVCHFIDLMQFLTDAEPLEVFSNALQVRATGQVDPDTLSANITFSDGSIGVITYAATGDPKFPKERVEVFGGGMTGVIDNWRGLSVSGGKSSLRQRKWLTAAKGHREELEAFVNGIETGTWPIDLRSLVLTSETTFAIQRSLRTGRPVPISIGGTSSDDESCDSSE
jgi:predicted dehydrogenase/threonine dehydrogenase-like Zn-dependent dehydrogenase